MKEQCTLSFPQTTKLLSCFSIGKKRKQECVKRVEKKIEEPSSVKRVDWKTCLAGHFYSTFS